MDLTDIRQRLFKQVTEEVDAGSHGKFLIRIISGDERQQYMDLVRGDPKEIDLYAFLVSLALCDAGGARVFKPDEVEDVKRIPATLLLDLFNAASNLNFPKLDDVKKN